MYQRRLGAAVKFFWKTQPWRSVSSHWQSVRRVLDSCVLVGVAEGLKRPLNAMKRDESSVESLLEKTNTLEWIVRENQHPAMRVERGAIAVTEWPIVCLGPRVLPGGSGGLVFFLLVWFSFCTLPCHPLYSIVDG
jgi:hypothetical protein